MSEAKKLALLDEALDLTGNWFTGRLALPPGIDSGFKRLATSEPLRTYTLSVPFEVVQEEYFAGRICLRAMSNLREFKGQSITLKAGIEAGLPRRMLLRAIDLYSTDSAEWLRLYAADVAALLTDAAPAEQTARLRSAVSLAQSLALTGKGADEARQMVAELEAMSGSVAEVHAYALKPDPAEAAQGANYLGNRAARALARDFLKADGPALGKMTSSVDRALTHLLARYDGGQP